MSHTTIFHDLELLTLNLFLTPLKIGKGCDKIAIYLFVFVGPLMTIKSKKIKNATLESRGTIFH